MTKEQFERKKMYQVTMNTIRQMLIAGLINDEEYCQIDTIFKQKYSTPCYLALTYILRISD